ncbi:histidine phosphatase family protein [Rhodoferax ferrireducens]|nr:histidine phosphatase family protein [Rhodoferax ferrireducens]
MMDPTRIIAIRHGETAWNVDTRIQGQLDIPLNATGRWQAQQLGLALAGEPITAVYASDLWRAYETALAVAGAVGLEIDTDEGLRERGFGVFQGHTFAEIEASLPDQALRWRKRDPEFAPEGGECLNDFRDRVVGCVQDLAARHPGELIAIVAHGGVMDVLYRAAVGLGLQDPRSWELGNAAINRLLWTPQGFNLVGWADTQHLEADTALDETSA